MWRWICVFALLGCAPAPPDVPSPVSPLVFDAAEVARARHIAVMIPGAFASVDMFAPARDWDGVAVVTYRFPGMDGLALDHRLDLQRAADEIAAFAALYPAAEVSLIGYSTGGPIALMVAAQIEGAVDVALISTAVDYAGGVQTALRTTGDVLGTAVQLGSVDPQAVWDVYWQSLLYGGDPAYAARVEALTAQHRPDLIRPLHPIFVAHTEDLRGWRLPADLDLTGVRVRVFAGAEDAVFSPAQTARFADRVGADAVWSYPGDNHLLVLTRTTLFDDVLAFIATP